MPAKQMIHLITKAKGSNKTNMLLVLNRVIQRGVFEFVQGIDICSKFNQEANYFELPIQWKFIRNKIRLQGQEIEH